MYIFESVENIMFSSIFTSETDSKHISKWLFAVPTLFYDLFLTVHNLVLIQDNVSCHVSPSLAGERKECIQSRCFSECSDKLKILMAFATVEK